MTTEQFTYWLQGFAELHQEPPTPEQWKSIKEHLALVFKKETPPVDLKPYFPGVLKDYKPGDIFGGPQITC